MMRGVLNVMRLQAEMAASGKVSTRPGTLTNYVPQDHVARVRLMPEDVMTGYLPIASQYVGNGWGMFAAPSAGDVVLVTFQEDDIDAGIITQRLFTDDMRPLNVPEGEFWLVHQSGSLLKFHNDGSVEIASHANLTATIGGDMTANVTGKAVINAAEIDLVGGGGGVAKGIVQGDCLCAFTGQPHAMVSSTIKATK